MWSSPYAALSTLDPDARDAFLRCGHVTTRPAHDLLLCQGDRADTVMLLEDGLVEVVLSDADGERLFVTFRNPGALLGEYGVLGRVPRSATVVALTEVRCRVWPAAVVREFFGRQPSGYADLARSVVDKTRGALLRQQHYGSGDPTRRVARVLLDYAATHGVPTPAGTMIDLPLSHERIAGLTHLSASTVAVHVRRLATARLVTSGYRGRRRVCVLDPAGLALRAEIEDPDVDPLRVAC